jgi:small-conductance mechanosensitive channel
MKYISQRLGLSFAALFLPAVLAARQTAPRAAAATRPSKARVAEAVKSEATASTGASVATGDFASAQTLAVKLLPLSNIDINSAAETKDILAHLNSILRLYRTASEPIQKVGEPSDVLYGEQSQSEAAQIARLAFQAAANEAVLLGKISGAATGVVNGQPAQGSDFQRMAALRIRVAQQSAALQARSDALEKQIATARTSELPALRQQKQQVEGGLQLQKAMNDALAKLGTTTDSAAKAGLGADIDKLLRSAPELQTAQGSKIPPPPVLQNLTAADQAGVSSQAVWLFQLLSTRHEIDNQIATLDVLSKQADDLRSPLVKVLRSVVTQGQALSDQTVNLQATPTTDAQDLANTRQTFDRLTETFQVLSAATLPLSEEISLLQQDRGTLTSWRNAVDAEYKLILRSLLLRLLFIAIALIGIVVVSQVWSRLTIKYVHDVRRRRQLLLTRRIVMGFVTGLVLIFGFVTQFSSLATFAGFITAGVAVGLQTILLSVAAYFFIVGRYGVKVGDRITVAGVTGDVIEVGLVRFYLTELAGVGTELHPTGRVAVFANSVLFQTGTPLYKQMPGTEYGWHTLTIKLTPTADRRAVTDAVVGVVSEVYAMYRQNIEAQQQQVEAWMGSAVDTPEITSRLQMVEGGPQLVVLFPVETRNAAEVDQQIAEKLADGATSNDVLKTGIASFPVIQPSLK